LRQGTSRKQHNEGTDLSRARGGAIDQGRRRTLRTK
jgi:hypothetical protein